MPDKINTSSDLQGIARLLTEATIGVTDVVEGMHKQIVYPPFLPASPIQRLVFNIAGFTYKSVKGGARMIGGGMERIFSYLPPLPGESATTKERETMRSVLNGIIGDQLEEKDNPLEIKMQFRYQGKTILPDPKSIAGSYPTVTGKILLMVHGSCLNDLQWTRQEHNHGTALAEELGQTPVYLHFNSGRHISFNGQDLNAKLEDLVLNWPVPVEEVAILAHSMGGLVTRSAVHYGQQQGNTWIKSLKKLVFLGTPHHGARLERMGNYVDVILGAIHHTKPIARLGKIRSSGVTDLRYGNLIDEDWQDRDRFQLQGDRRKTIPLPESVACYSIAAVVGKAKVKGSARWVGDRLVDVKSALGQHSDPGKDLHFPPEHTWITYETSHLDLLSSPDAFAKTKFWLA